MGDLVLNKPPNFDESRAMVNQWWCLLLDLPLIAIINHYSWLLHLFLTIINHHWCSAVAPAACLLKESLFEQIVDFEPRLRMSAAELGKPRWTTEASGPQNLSIPSSQAQRLLKQETASWWWLMFDDQITINNRSNNNDDWWLVLGY